jgi:hypothetical protein
MTTDYIPQAFPCLDSSDGMLSMRDPGMTLRDWFAGQALIALVNNAGDEPLSDICAGIRAGKPLAVGAYAIADAMLAARKGTAP